MLDIFCPRWIIKAGYQYIFILFLFSRIFFTVKSEVLNIEFVLKFQYPCFFAKLRLRASFNVLSASAISILGPIVKMKSMNHDVKQTILLPFNHHCNGLDLSAAFRLVLWLLAGGFSRQSLRDEITMAGYYQGEYA